MAVTPKKKLVVLASGDGTNFAAIASAAQAGEISATVAALVTNSPRAGALEKARALGVRTEIVDSATYRNNGRLDRNAYEARLLDVVKDLQPDLICLAGYMLILGDRFIAAFPDRIVNIHPSLLPKYRGLNAIGQALKAGEKETGCSVHWVVPAVDAGPVIVQRALPILESDTESTLRERLRPMEHAAYIEALKQILS